MKDKAYRTSLNVDGDGGKRKAECECPRGNDYVAQFSYCPLIYGCFTIEVLTQKLTTFMKEH